MGTRAVFRLRRKVSASAVAMVHRQVGKRNRPGAIYLLS